MFYGNLYDLLETKGRKIVRKVNKAIITTILFVPILLLFYSPQAIAGSIRRNCLAPSLLTARAGFKKAFQPAQSITAQKFLYARLPNEAKPIPIGRLIDFVNNHQYFQQAYSHEDNSAYPTGCGSFSHLVGEKMLKDGGDVYVLWSAMRDHYYLSMAVTFSDGITEEVVVDYTADQMGHGAIAPLIATRTFLQRNFPDTYPLYYSKKYLIGKPKDINMDNFYLEYIQIWELIMDMREQRQAALFKKFSESNVLSKRTSIMQCDFLIEGSS